MIFPILMYLLRAFTGNKLKNILFQRNVENLAKYVNTKMLYLPRELFILLVIYLHFLYLVGIF